MVPFELTYYRPDTVDEAVDLYQQLLRTKRHPAFYGGGTEILTRTRVQDAHFDAVIDLKHIPEVRVHRAHQGALEFGAGLSLTELADRNLWPLLTATADRVADHTTRSQITLGGNLLSVLPYREAMLPWLLMDTAEARLAGPSGFRRLPFANLYDEEIKLKPGEFLVSVSISGREAQEKTFRSRKMTRLDWIDYPLVAIAMTKNDQGRIRAAFSGWSGFPFVSPSVNKILSDRRKTPTERAREAISQMPFTAISDMHGSSEYREFVAAYTLAEMLTELEEEDGDARPDRTGRSHHDH